MNFLYWKTIQHLSKNNSIILLIIRIDIGKDLTAQKVHGVMFPHISVVGKRNNLNSDNEP